MTRRHVTVLASSSILFLAACSGTTISRDSDSGGKGGKSQGEGGAAGGNGGTAGGKGGTSAAGSSGRGGVTAIGGASVGGRGNGGAPGAGGTAAAGRSGTGGAAGRSDTGGAAGMGGAEPIDAGDVDGSPPRCNELASASPLSWGMDGGLVAYVDGSSLTAPRRYQHTRDYPRNGMQQLTCTTEPGCPAAIIAEINSALQSSAVQSALTAHTVFGVDSRPSDGQVFRVSVGSGYLDVGTECPPPSSSCRPVLPEVQALVSALQNLDVQELRKPACTAVFGPS